MTRQRLEILYVSPVPPSPPRFGLQARMHGLMTNVARHHEITAISLVDEQFDVEESARAMRQYCRDVAFVPNPNARGGAKRRLQLRSLASPRSFERHLHSAPTLQRALDGVLLRRRFDLVAVETPNLAHLRLRQSPPGTPPPVLVLNAHEIAYDLARQLAGHAGGLARGVYGSLNWRKLRRDERSAFRTVDGTCVCSAIDQARLLADIPSARTAVVPNAADVDYLQPRHSDPPSDGRTVVFFGLLSTAPNIDGVAFLVEEIWPLIAAERPDARCKIIGPRPHPQIWNLAGPGVQVVGPVDDLRPHLASAAVVVVPLRMGGGTRLKIVEAMAMGKAIVSTTLGAEGIEAIPDRDILIADERKSFAAAVVRFLDDAALRARVGQAARELAVQRYSWAAAGARLERFFEDVLDSRGSAG